MPCMPYVSFSGQGFVIVFVELIKTLINYLGIGRADLMIRCNNLCVKI